MKVERVNLKISKFLGGVGKLQLLQVTVVTGGRARVTV